MVDYHIEPLDQDELTQYIRHRLSIAAHSNNGKKLNFIYNAIASIFAFSQGVPRLINLICERALLLGFIHEENTINETIITNCINDIKL